MRDCPYCKNPPTCEVMPGELFGIGCRNPACTVKPWVGVYPTLADAVRAWELAGGYATGKWFASAAGQARIDRLRRKISDVKDAAADRVRWYTVELPEARAWILEQHAKIQIGILDRASVAQAVADRIRKGAGFFDWMPGDDCEWRSASAATAWGFLAPRQRAKFHAS